MENEHQINQPPKKTYKFTKWDAFESRYYELRRRIFFIGAAAVVLTGFVLIGYRFGITLWDWVKLLVVPTVITGGGIWFNRQQRERELAVANQRAQDDALQAYLDQISQMLTDKDQPLHEAKPGDSWSTVARARTLTTLSRLDGSRKGSLMQFLRESGLIRNDKPVFHLEGVDLSRALLSGSDFSRLTLTKADLRYADLRWANLNEANLSEANLSKAGIPFSDLRGANLREATLRETSLREADLSGADLSGVSLYKADLGGAKLIEVNWRTAFLYAADLGSAELGGANLSELTLVEAQLDMADLSGAKLIDADLRDAHLFLTKLIQADLSGADLSGAELDSVDLSEAKLVHTDLSDARLIGAKLINTDLSDADLSGAKLRFADLSGAKEWNKEQLWQVKSLEGATMPDGRTLKNADNPDGPTFEDWLKSKGSGEEKNG